MAPVVVDTSAVIAAILGESGAESVGRHIGQAMMSAVNFQEAVKVLLSSPMSLDSAIAAIDRLRLDLRPHDREAAIAAAGLFSATRSIGSGIGDRTCMALGIASGRAVLTADREWKKLAIPGLFVELIR